MRHTSINEDDTTKMTTIDATIVQTYGFQGCPRLTRAHQPAIFSMDVRERHRRSAAMEFRSPRQEYCSRRHRSSGLRNP
jgi:hypothetical protein